MISHQALVIDESAESEASELMWRIQTLPPSLAAATAATIHPQLCSRLFLLLFRRTLTLLSFDVRPGSDSLLADGRGVALRADALVRLASSSGNFKH